MKTITIEELKEVLIQHKNWIENNYTEDQTKNAKQANLFDTDLRNAGLSSADLRSADLRSADLSYANLRSADLKYAGLSSADLKYAGLSYADLKYADLSYANLSCADLRSADLSYANLSYANLKSANLDFSVLPLWCGSFDIIVDQRLPFQLAYHICRLKSEDPEVKELQKLLIPYANKTHLIKDHHILLIPTPQ